MAILIYRYANLTGKVSLGVFMANELATRCVYFSAGQFAQPDCDEIGGASNAGSDCQSFCWAVLSTRTTFHAGVKVEEKRFLFFHCKDAMRADGNAHATANTFFLVQLEGGDAFYIAKFFHGVGSLSYKWGDDPLYKGKQSATCLPWN